MKKKETKKPLDMTTDEAMNFLFPKKVSEELKRIAKPPKKPAEQGQHQGGSGKGKSDTSYKYIN